VFKLIVGIFIFIASPVFADAVTALRDPTIPLGNQATNYAEEKIVLHLNSILISQQRKLAIINGQAVRQGDEIKGTSFRVISIRANSVSLKSNSESRVLSMIDSKVKK